MLFCYQEVCTSSLCETQVDTCKRRMHNLVSTLFKTSALNNSLAIFYMVISEEKELTTDTQLHNSCTFEEVRIPGDKSRRYH